MACLDLGIWRYLLIVASVEGALLLYTGIVGIFIHSFGIGIARHDQFIEFRSKSCTLEPITRQHSPKETKINYARILIRWIRVSCKSCANLRARAYKMIDAFIALDGASMKGTRCIGEYTRGSRCRYNYILSCKNIEKCIRSAVSVATAVSRIQLDDRSSGEWQQNFDNTLRLHSCANPDNARTPIWSC